MILLVAVLGSASYDPFESTTERLAREAHAARVAGELALASSLLAEAEAAAGGGSHPRLMHEKALLLVARGERDLAAELLRRTADLDPKSEARLDLAALLADLGRWPETVVVLRAAFSERGATLRADAVMTDPRFAKLVGFPPYQALMAQVREEQAGWLGKLQLKLESIDASIRGFQAALDRLTQFVTRLTGLLSSPTASIVTLVLLAFLIASGLGQMRLVPAPWSSIVGVAAASVLWRAGTLLLSEGKNEGWDTIVPALALVVVPVGVAAAARWLLRRRARGAAASSPAGASQRRDAS